MGTDEHDRAVAAAHNLPSNAAENGGSDWPMAVGRHDDQRGIVFALTPTDHGGRTFLGGDFNGCLHVEIRDDLL